jgi:shikimate dehydrogenase
MRQFGLIGYPLSHSFSKKYFSRKFSEEGIDAMYENYPLSDIKELHSLLSELHLLEGLNVTIPYKQAVIPFLNQQSDVVRETGACNCIRIINGKLEGFNTDVTGFDQALSAKLTRAHNKAIVLGTGGAAKAVCYVLDKKGISWLQVSRIRKELCISYEELSSELISEYPLIINTTPLGMFPDINTCPQLPYHAIGTSHYLFDLVYNPTLTKFLQQGKARGALIENGYNMLVIQAEESWKHWNA